MAQGKNPMDNLKLDLPDLNLEKLELPESLDELEDEINKRFDDFEEALPSPLDSMFRLQRTMFDTTYLMTKSAAESVNEASSVMMKQAQSSAQRFADTFKKQVGLLQDDAVRMAEASRNAATDVGRDVEEATDKANRRVEKLADQADNYDAWTKDELYDAAQELDIHGRSSMNKKQLAKAVRKARSQPS